MKKFFCLIFFSILIFPPIFSNEVFAAEPKITYTVSMPFPSNHLFEVEINIQNFIADENHTDISLPAWRPGRYVILNFSSGVQEFSAEKTNGAGLEWNKTDKDTWRIQNIDRTDFKVRYKVYANEFSIRTRGLNDERGFIDATAVLMYAEKLRHNPLVVNIIPYVGWHVTTGLDVLTGFENSFAAENYDYIADCPILIGRQIDVDFFYKEKKHTVSFSGDGNYNTDTVVNDLKKIVETISGFWGDIPYEHFTFMLFMTTQDQGATEHLNSTVICIHPLIFNNRERYTTFLSTCAHEYFHTWNVKRLRPKAIEPYDFTKENYVSELWIAEGLTSYYQNIILARTGYLTSEKYLDLISNNIQVDIERPGNYIQTLEESSFDAWVKRSTNTQNKFISESDFYLKGANVGLLLDLEIRSSSKNKYSLDDVMKTMYNRFPRDKGGYTNDDFIRVCEEFEGKDLKEFFDSYLYGLDSLDWKKYLGYAGLNLIVRHDTEKTFAGLSTRESGDRLFISSVIPGTPAYKAGLDMNDEIIALNGYRVRSSNLISRISDMKKGDVVKLTIMREEKLREFEITLEGFKSVKYKVEKIKDPSQLQKKIFEEWLSAK